MTLKASRLERKKEKLSIFTDDMILYIENPKKYTHTYTHKLIE